MCDYIWVVAPSSEYFGGLNLGESAISKMTFL